MKFTIDTDLKIIEVDSQIELGVFFEQIKYILGKDWKNYKIQSKINYWNYPIVYYDDSFKPPYEITCNPPSICEDTTYYITNN